LDKLNVGNRNRNTNSNIRMQYMYNVKVSTYNTFETLGNVFIINFNFENFKYLYLSINVDSFFS